MDNRDRKERALSQANATLAAISGPSFYSRRHDLFGRRRRLSWRRRYEALWPFATAWSALCTMGSLPGHQGARDLLEAMVPGLRSYSRQHSVTEEAAAAGFEAVVTPPRGGGGDRYYDDNAWVGLALVRQHELTGNPHLLEMARQVFAFVISGWSVDASWHTPGGIRWKETASNRSRNTCANAPASELAAKLHEATGQRRDLDWAIRIYGWTRDALHRPDGLYADRMAPDGARNETIWSYNQGAMIGAGILLHRQTGDPSFRSHALETASAYLGSRSAPDLMTQDPAFNAVFFRNVLLLDGEDACLRQARSVAADYASTMWASRRRRGGLFAGNGSPLNNTAAMLQIYALLAGAPPHP